MKTESKEKPRVETLPEKKSGITDKEYEKLLLALKEIGIFNIFNI